MRNFPTPICKVLLLNNPLKIQKVLFAKNERGKINIAFLFNIGFYGTKDIIRW